MTTTTTATAFVLFVPNKRSIPRLTVDPYQKSQLHQFLTDYFRGNGEGQQFKPYAYAAEMLDDLGYKTFDSASLLANDGWAPCYDTIQAWLEDVTSNFGVDAILICEPAQEVE